MKALFFFLSALLVANTATAESPPFAAVRDVVTNAIQECHNGGARNSLGLVLVELAPEIESLTPANQSDRDTLEELRQALDEYKDCL